jgi:hypothetical protein
MGTVNQTSIIIQKEWDNRNTFQKISPDVSSLCVLAYAQFTLIACPYLFRKFQNEEYQTTLKLASFKISLPVELTCDDHEGSLLLEQQIFYHSNPQTQRKTERKNVNYHQINKIN